MAEVINWAWQGVLLVLIVGGFTRMSRRFAAAARYRLWWAALIGIMVMPAAALWMRSQPVAAIQPVDIEPLVELPARVSLAVPLFLTLWVGWTILFLARIGVALAALRRLKRGCMPFPDDREARLPHWLSVRRTGRPSMLVVSPGVGSAAVLGGLAPVIAVSPTLLRRLDDEDLDQIVLHEWAHVQRRDDVAQLAQQLIRAAIGWHPAIWWSTRQLQFERELACDERVALATGAPKRYAACLARLATVMSGERVPAGMPAALSPQLATRIARLVQQSHRRPARPSLIWAAAGTGLLLAALVVSASIPLIGELAPRLEAAISLSEERKAGLRQSTAAPGTEGVMMTPITTSPRATRPGPTRASAVPRHQPAAPPEAAVQAIVPADGGRGGRPAPDEIASRAPDEIAFRAPAMTAMLRPRGLPEAASLPVVPGDSVSITPPTPPMPNRGAPSTTPWSAAADAGVAVGRGSARAARATAGFFTRMSKSIAGGI